MKARVKYPAEKNEDKKNAGKKAVVGTKPLSNGEVKCNGNVNEAPKVDNCQSEDQGNLQTERNAHQIGETSIMVILFYCIAYSMYQDDEFILFWKYSKILSEIPEMRKSSRNKKQVLHKSELKIIIESRVSITDLPPPAAPPAPTLQGSSNGIQSNHDHHQPHLTEAATSEDKHELESPKKTPLPAPTRQQIISFIESEPVFDRSVGILLRWFILP